MMVDIFVQSYIFDMIVLSARLIFKFQMLAIQVECRTDFKISEY